MIIRKEQLLNLLQNTRFYFRTTGIEAVYNQEPEIIAEDIDVYKGQNNLNLKNGVKVKDDHDKINEDGTLKESNNNPNISIATTTTPEKNVLKYTITQKLGSDTDEVIDTTTLGERTVTYTYTDSWGRTGTTTRKVVVRPQLYKNRIQVYSEENESLSSEITYE